MKHHGQTTSETTSIVSGAVVCTLSVIAGIFLPLSLVTGLLGINVGGVPGTQNAAAFWIVTFALVVMGLLLVVVVRRMKML